MARHGVCSFAVRNLAASFLCIVQKLIVLLYVVKKDSTLVAGRKVQGDYELERS